MQLYDFQITACNDILQSPTSSNLLQSATGSGKTVMAGYLCNQYLSEGSKVLFIAHRKELIEQAKDKFFEQFGIDSSLIRADEKTNLSLNMQIASVQTFNKRLNFTPDKIIIDECHRSEAATYQKIIKAFPNAKLIGLSATPYRLSGKGLNNTYSRMIQTKSIKELEELGFLVPAICYTYPIDHKKLSQISVIGSDYNEHELAEIMEDRAMIEDIVVSYLAELKGKKTICFASSVKHSEMICRHFNEMGVKAVHVDAKDKERDSKIQSFRDSDTLVLCNVAIATEGFDLKECMGVILARPTFSLALYLQMVGRGSRTLEGKESFKVLDHSNNVIEHGAPNKEHDWNMYYEGVTKKQIERLKEGKRFKAIDSEGNEYTIEDIYNIPFDVKGFVLEEIENTRFLFSPKKTKPKDRKKSLTECRYCGSKLERKGAYVVFCNNKCSMRYHKKVPIDNKISETVNCLHCNSEFIKKHEHHIFCSSYCQKSSSNKREFIEKKICPMCKASFHITSLKQVYCSTTCYNHKRDLTPSRLNRGLSKGNYNKKITSN